MAVGRGTASTALLGDMRSGNALGNAARPLVGDGVLSMRHLVKTNYSLIRTTGVALGCGVGFFFTHCVHIDWFKIHLYHEVFVLKLLRGSLAIRSAGEQECLCSRCALVWDST